MSEDEALELLEAWADCLEAEARRKRAVEQKLAAAGKVLRIARRTTTDPALTDDEAALAARARAIAVVAKIGEPAPCPS